jgi:hypothetical protein
LCHDDRVLLPVEWVPATVPAADADLLVREGLFLGIRAVTAFPTGAAFRLVIRVRDENVVDGVDYRAICGHSLRGSPPPADGLAVRAQAETAGAVSECQIWRSKSLMQNPFAVVLGKLADRAGTALLAGPAMRAGWMPSAPGSILENLILSCAVHVSITMIWAKCRSCQAAAAQPRTGKPHG